MLLETAVYLIFIAKQKVNRLLGMMNGTPQSSRYLGL
jgi:hypothetical protein